MGGTSIYLDFNNLRYTLLNSISQLTVMLGLYGRLSPMQLLLQSILYNLLWNLNFFLNILLKNSSPDTRLYDDYQIANVYLFAGAYGLIVSFLLKKPDIAALRERFTHNDNSLILAQIGTFFLFLSFCGTTALISQKSYVDVKSMTFVRNFVWQ
jgi:hypothetical protein